MEKVINLKAALWILLIIEVIIFYCLPVTEAVINSLCKTISILTLICVLFNKYLWKLKIFQGWLVKIPNLNGEWTGKIESDYIDKETGKVIDPVNVELNIRQSLLKISCVMKTEEMRSISLNSNFNVDKNNQILQLIYTYKSTPHQNIQGRSRMHHGTIIFDIDKENNKDIVLRGNYWTGRKTSGNITLRKKQ